MNLKSTPSHIVKRKRENKTKKTSIKIDLKFKNYTSDTTNEEEKKPSLARNKYEHIDKAIFTHIISVIYTIQWISIYSLYLGMAMYEDK